MSTLADLEPEIFEELRFPDLQATRSSRGSVRFPIKQPQKSAEGGRAYVHGDPLNMIDWRAFARTDQLIVREQQKEATAKIAIFVDLRSSMDWPDASLEGFLSKQELPIKKQDIAAKIALNLAFRHLREQDLVHLIIISDGTRYHLAKVRTRNDIHNLYEEILPSLAIENLDQINLVDLQIQRFDVAYLVSDMLIEPELNLSLLQNAKAKLLIQILSSLEIDNDWMQGDKIYFELLDTQEYQGETLLSGDSYRKELARWLNGIEIFCQQLNVNRYLFSDKTELAVYFKMMREFLDARMRI